MIDFHCHVDLYSDPQNIARQCEERGIYVLSVTNTPSAWEHTDGLLNGYKRVRTAWGIHPQLAKERKSELGLFRRLLPRVPYVGEVGLDGSTQCLGYWEDQLTVFNAVLEMCEGEGGRILSIHSRRAVSAVLSALSAHPKAGTAVLHWFSGSFRELHRAIDSGCWFSVNEVMLNSTKGRALVTQMPKDRVLTESDGPFALAKGRAALPWDIADAVRAIATIWEVALEAAEGQLLSNLRALVSGYRVGAADVTAEPPRMPLPGRSK
jgi:TatD DNase family protein